MVNWRENLHKTCGFVLRSRWISFGQRFYERQRLDRRIFHFGPIRGRLLSVRQYVQIEETLHYINVGGVRIKHSNLHTLGLAKISSIRWTYSGNNFKTFAFGWLAGGALLRRVTSRDFLSAASGHLFMQKHNQLFSNWTDLDIFFFNLFGVNDGKMSFFCALMKSTDRAWRKRALQAKNKFFWHLNEFSLICCVEHKFNHFRFVS